MGAVMGKTKLAWYALKFKLKTVRKIGAIYHGTVKPCAALDRTRHGIGGQDFESHRTQETRNT
jgi:hypothetical protein